MLFVAKVSRAGIDSLRPINLTHYPEEAPAHKVSVGGFWMDRHTVTNRDFRLFVEATGYRTLAERPANDADYPGALPELLLPSSVVFKKARNKVDLRDPYNWWTYVAGADWLHPRGPSDQPGRPGMLWIPGGTFLMGSDKHRPMRLGSARNFRPKPNGSLRRAAAPEAR